MYLLNTDAAGQRKDLLAIGEPSNVRRGRHTPPKTILATVPIQTKSCKCSLGLRMVTVWERRQDSFPVPVHPRACVLGPLATVGFLV